MAHGGDTQWNGMVRKAVREADLDAPTEVVLGMGMHSGEVRRLREAVNRLERRGIARLIVIPFLVSSHSEVFRQYEYLLGARDRAEWPEVGSPLELEVPVVMGRALDDDPAVAEVLLERAKTLSRTPAEETVVIVGHGPNGDADNERWLAVMRRLAEPVREGGGFREVTVLTIRDDAPRAVRDHAVRELRDAVQRAGWQGRALVVPLLLAQGGIEDKIPKLLAGLPAVYKGHTLLPHPNITDWITQQVNQLASQPEASQALATQAGSAHQEAVVK